MKEINNESGFTLIELIYTVVIVGVLAVLSIQSYYEYRQRANYANAESILRNARTAFTAFETRSGGPSDEDVGLTFSGSDGESLEGDLETILPALNVSPGVRLGALYNYCESGSNPAALNTLVVSQPCKGAHYTTWLKFCGGLEILNRKILQPGDVC